MELVEGMENLAVGAAGMEQGAEVVSTTTTAVTVVVDEEVTVAAAAVMAVAEEAAVVTIKMRKKIVVVTTTGIAEAMTIAAAAAVDEAVEGAVAEAVEAPTTVAAVAIDGIKTVKTANRHHGEAVIDGIATGETSNGETVVSRLRSAHALKTVKSMLLYAETAPKYKTTASVGSRTTAQEVAAASVVQGAVVAATIDRLACPGSTKTRTIGTRDHINMKRITETSIEPETIHTPLEIRWFSSIPPQISSY